MTIPVGLPLAIPYTDGLLVGFLRPALPDVQVVTVMPPAEQHVYPTLLIRRVAGRRVHPRFLDDAVVAADAFAATRREAERTIEASIQALEYAWWHQLSAPDGAGLSGHIVRFGVDDAPSELRDRDQAADVYRFNSSLSLLIRPS